MSILYRMASLKFFHFGGFIICCLKTFKPVYTVNLQISSNAAFDNRKGLAYLKPP